MNKILSLILAILVGIAMSHAQPISKKESAAIDAILARLSKDHKPGSYIIRNVNILTMKDAQVSSGQDVLVGNGVIQQIGTGIQNANATVIDGTGKFLMPGLTDMHVHLFAKHPMKNTWMLLLLMNGVTTVRDMCGESGKTQLREKIKHNEILGPNLYQAGLLINITKDNPNIITQATTPEQGREIVRDHKKAGYDYIKVYDGLSKEVYTAIADEAQKQGLPVVGHLPDKVTLDDAISAKHHSIEHLTGYFEWKDSQVIATSDGNFASKTANSAIWNCPTLYNHFMNGSRKGAGEMLTYAGASGLLPDGIRDMWQKRISSNSKAIEEIVDKYGASNFETMKKIVLELHASGAKLIAGTDAGSLPLLIPGYSLHQELRLMNEICIPTFDVLRMTTVNASQAMNGSSEFGTIETGKHADLLLLNANPMDGIANLEDKAGVMVRGIWLSKEDLDELNSSVKAAFGH